MRSRLNRLRLSTDGSTAVSSDGAFPRAELDALHETALLVADRHEMPELLRLILTRAAALVGVDDAFLYFLKPDGQTLAIVAGIGEFAAQIGFSVAIGEGLAGRVAAEGEPLTVADHGSDGGRSQRPGPMRVRTIVGAPLRGTEGILGVIGLARGDSSGFDEEEIALLDRFGRVAAIALDNARLHESLQVELAERRRTEEELLDTVSRLSRSELELRRAQAETIRKLADAAEFRDAETGHHTERMSRMCELIARRMGLDEERCRLLRDASPLHDIGKIAIPDEILLKRDRFTDQERRTMQRHAEIGHRLLSGSASEVLELAATIALVHHERWDGNGYPYGLAGEAIPLEGRIASVADVFDALTTDRVYRAAMPVEEALATMREQRGCQFDPLIFDVLEDIARETQHDVHAEGDTVGDEAPGPRGEACGGHAARCRRPSRRESR